MNLTLPFPPTVNTYWRHITVGGQPRTLISKRGRAYAQQVGRRKLEQAPGQCYPLGTRLRLSVSLCAPDRRARDLDNCLKALLDSLQKAGAFESDSQIDELHVKRGPTDKPLGRVEVDIEPLA